MCCRAHIKLEGGKEAGDTELKFTKKNSQVSIGKPKSFEGFLNLSVDRSVLQRTVPAGALFSQGDFSAKCQRKNVASSQSFCLSHVVSLTH